jgi:hypothetical protein
MDSGIIFIMYTHSQENGKSNNNKGLLGPSNTTLLKHLKNPINKMKIEVK